MKIQLICENCNTFVELTPKTNGQHANIQEVESKFRIEHMQLDIDKNVDDIGDVEATIDEIRFDCKYCDEYIVLNNFPSYVYRY